MEYALAVGSAQAVVVDLAEHFNNVGITARTNLADGRFNVWRNSFPADELPDGSGAFTPAGIPFHFPRSGDGRPDNVVCRGQRISLPPGRYDWIYLLTCSERRTEDVVHLHYRDGAADPEWLRVSDFWPAAPRHFGEVEAIGCERIHFARHVQANNGPRIWQQRIPVPRQEDLMYLRLPENIAVHIFAMTAVSAAWRPA
jgi:hypothetical protein